MSIFLWVFALPIGTACPQASCGPLPPPLCGSRYNSTVVVIADSGCQTGETCSVAGLVAWAGGTTTNVSCVGNMGQGQEVGIEWSYAPCVAKRDNQGWKNGGSVVMCRKDGDCLKEDGTYDTGACVCVPRSDSSGTCSPDPNNLSIFSPYWASCDAGGGQLTDQNEYLFWAFSIENWVYLQSDLQCVRKLLEFGEYNRLLGLYSSAGALSMSVILMYAWQ